MAMYDQMMEASFDVPSGTGVKVLDGRWPLELPKDHKPDSCWGVWVEKVSALCTAAAHPYLASLCCGNYRRTVNKFLPEVNDQDVWLTASKLPKAGRKNVFGRTDRGKKGMHDFFRTHKCSNLCEMLQRRWVRRADTADDRQQHAEELEAVDMS